MINLRTRSKSKDYTFWGPEQDGDTWKNQYNNFYAETSKYVILEVNSKTKEWKVFISGIPSVRKDEEMRPISFDLNAIGVLGRSSESIFLYKLLKFIFLKDTEPFLGKVGLLFDKYLTADFIDSFDGSRDTNEAKDKIDDAIKSLSNDSAINIELPTDDSNVNCYFGVYDTISILPRNSRSSIIESLLGSPIEGNEGVLILTDCPLYESDSKRFVDSIREHSNYAILTLSEKKFDGQLAKPRSIGNDVCSGEDISSKKVLTTDQKYAIIAIALLLMIAMVSLLSKPNLGKQDRKAIEMSQEVSSEHSLKVNSDSLQKCIDSLMNENSLLIENNTYLIKQLNYKDSLLDSMKDTIKK